MEPDMIHTPVLLDRCIDLFEPSAQNADATLIDATLGMGGHSRHLLEAYPRMRVIGIDRDEDALHIARRRLESFGERVTFVHATYDAIALAAEEGRASRIDGVLFDLGVSSLQLDEAERGFSYSHDAPLDMRMDSGDAVTAEHVLNTYSEKELQRIFRQYGEEKLAPRYARAIVREREVSPLTRSGELVSLIERATPAAVRRSGHPAKRVFQALRIEVNGELDVLERAIPNALDAVAVGGRVVVLSYQSLEDRLVKRAFSRASSSTAPVDLPVELPEHKPRFRLVTHGAEKATEKEIELNSRAAPVRLRAVERIRGNDI